MSATVLVAISAGVLAGCDVNISTSTSPPITTCGVKYLEHDATALFTGPNATDVCTAMKKGDGNWYDLADTSATPEGALVCTGTMPSGVTWKVYDSGGHVIGDQACASINQYSANH